MGTAEESYPGSGVYYYYFGGEPLPDWSGLRPKARIRSNMCFRPLDPVAGQKSTIIRTTGMKEKFAKTSRLTEFQKKVFKHLRDTGLDTVAYLPDPRDASNVLNVVEYHAQFTSDSVAALASSKKIQAQFDEWDKVNDYEATTYLLDSLEVSIREDIDPFLEEQDSFAATWLKLVKHLIITTSKTFDDIKATIRSTRPQQFEGQNIELMSKTFIRLATELNNAGYYEHTLTLNMVEGFLKASMDSVGTFHYAMNKLREEVDAKVQASVFLPKQDQQVEFAKAKLLFKDVCARATDSYKSLKGNNQWEPSKLPIDRRAPQVNLSDAQILTILENMSKQHNIASRRVPPPRGSTRPRKCFNCNSPDHLVKDCPHPPRAGLKSPRARPPRQKSKWKNVKPGPNESETKVVNGKTFHWCAKCNCWSTTHGTATHTGRSNGQGKSDRRDAASTPRSGPESNLMIFDPSAWIISAFDDDVPVPASKPSSAPSRTWPQIWWMSYFALTFVVLLGSFLVPLVQSSWPTVSAWFSDIFCLVQQWIPVLAGPVTWLLSGYGICYLHQCGTTFTPSTELFNNSRITKKNPFKAPRDIPTPVSAFRCNLHHQYPLRLRNNNTFVTRQDAPSHAFREFCHAFDNYKSLNDYHDLCDKFVAHMSGQHPQFSPCNFSRVYPDVEPAVKRPLHMKSYTKHHPSVQPCHTRNHCHPKGVKMKHANPRSPSDYQSKGAQSQRYYHKSKFESLRSRRRRPRNRQWKKTAFNDLEHPPPTAPPALKLSESDCDNRKDDNYMCPASAKATINHSFCMASTEVEHPSSLSPVNNIASLSPNLLQATVHGHSDSLYFPVIWDTGASVCVTPCKNDFVTYEHSDIGQVKGLGGVKSSVMGKGELIWAVHDVNGSLRHLKLPAYHIPKSQSRLISTTSLLQRYQGEHLHVTASGLQLSGIAHDPVRTPVLVHNNPKTRLPTVIAYLPAAEKVSREIYCNLVNTVSEENQNLTSGAKELMRWHQRLGHMAFRKVQHLMRSDILAKTPALRQLHQAAAKIKETPKCAACLFGKQVVRSNPSSVTSVVKDRAGILQADKLHPGMEVSVDHFHSTVKGRLFTGYNKGSDDTRSMGGCIFVDSASSFIHIEFQSSLSSHDTLRAKAAFEHLCRDSGVMVQSYRSDNGKAFTARDYSDHLLQFHQISKFAGVGAHHQNARAERAIRTIMTIARTMMIHAGTLWPDMADASLWPMAVSHATFLHNHMPNLSTGLSPSDIFTKVRWPHRRFHDLHVWGCPVYVLDKKLADGFKLPRWKPRSERTINMGLSSAHASSAPLVLRPSTGAITPQFHVVFDDWFATVGSSPQDVPNFQSNEWYKMFGDSVFQYNTEDNADTSDETPHPEDTADFRNFVRRQDDVTRATDGPLQHYSWPAIPPPQTSDKLEGGNSGQMPSSPPVLTPLPSTSSEVAPSISSPATAKPSLLPQRKQMSPQRKSSTPKSPAKVEPRRSSRSTQPVRRLTYQHGNTKEAMDISVTQANMALAFIQEANDDFVNCPFADAQVLLSSKKASNPDLISFDEAMASEHKSEWIKAAVKEIQSLEELKCWDEIPLSEATSKVLPGTWVFRVKRAPDGTFKKFKARYCIRGDLQEGDFETFAPVVQFSTVRLFLAWSLMLSWLTCSIDFSSAFIQASLDEPVFIHLPRGFKSELPCKTCLSLRKSIYGLAVAPRLWFQHLLKAMKQLGFVQSAHDPCLLLKSNLIVICYVDDLGLAYPEQRVADKFVQDIKSLGFELTVEGSFTEYLGIKYEHGKDGTVHMTQAGLIEKILDATGLKDCNPNRTPCTKEALGSNPDGDAMTDSWNYWSVVGMLLYLSTNTRPDIAYSVSQVARFSHSPKQVHAKAVKTIVRYLSGTKSKGVIYKRPDKLGLDCYVDADFAGLYGQEPEENPVSVKSRTGYIISVGGCFVICKSQLQSTIALSTSESEYAALSQAMRAVLPIREVMLELIATVKMNAPDGTPVFGPKADLLRFQTLVFEDNATALALATKQKITSRTKHWSIKFHFFWQHVNDKSKNIQCLKVASELQKADYLTKGLSKDVFERCRCLSQGW